MESLAASYPALAPVLAHPFIAAAAGLVITLVLAVMVADVVLNIKASSSLPNAPPVWKGGYPLVGHFLSFAKGPLVAIAKGYKANGPVFTLRFLGFNFTFVIGPDAQGPFFNANDNELSQNEPYRFMTPIFGRGIVFDAPVEIKDEQLRFVASALKGTALKSYVPLIVEEADRYFEEHWGDSGSIDLLDAMSFLTILTASRCLLGREVREHLFGDVYRLLREIDEGINPIAIINPYLPLPSFRRRDVARAQLAEVFGKLIASRRAATGEKPDDMLQCFIDANYSDGTSCTDDQIVGMLIGALFAGQHTSSITSTWTTLMLLHHADVKARVMEELVRATGTTDPSRSDVMTMNNIQAMDLLQNCVKESLRQYPPLIMLMRKAHVDVAVGDYTIPKGHYVFSSPPVTMNLEDGAAENVFANPTKWDPDRFAKPREEDKKKKFSFCAFGGGKHGCLGEQFGYIQVKAIVAIMLRRYEIETVGPMPKPNYEAMVVGPLQTNNSCIVKYRRRTAPLPAPAGFVEAPRTAAAAPAGAAASS